MSTETGTLGLEPLWTRFITSDPQGPFREGQIACVFI